MSQAGEIDVVGNHPQIPTEFVADVGSAVPIGNTLEILTAITPSGTEPLESTASGNTVTINAQISQAIVATDSTKIGLSAFDSGSFNVDANGFVSLKGGGLAIDSISPNSGTDPILPDGTGKVSILGTGSITTVGSLNTETIQLTGLTAHAVLLGAGTATITNLPTTSTAGQVLQTTGSATDPAYSTATYPSTTTMNQVLYSSATNTIAGLPTINRGAFTTNSSGVPTLVSLNGDGRIVIGSASSQPAFGTLTPGTGISITNGANSITVSAANSVATTYNADSGSATPVANSLTMAGSGSIASSASGSTVTYELTGLTNHNVLLGSGTSTITKVAPSVTSGVPLISQGSAADPIFGTAIVAGGGTGNATQAAYSLVAGGTTTTGAFQAVGPDSSTHSLLYGQGTSVLPAFLTNGTPYVSGISFDSGTTTLSSYLNTTFLPTLTFGGGSTGITYTSRVGFYTRIGNFISVSINLELLNKGSSTGVASITGLPFTSSSTGTFYILNGYFLGMASFPGSTTIPLGLIGSSSSSVDIYGYLGGGSGSTSQFSNSNFNNNSILRLNGFYRI